MENLRFDPGEEANDPAFVDRLVEGQDLYVDDAFGAAHRAHASVVGPPARLPCAAGRVLAQEVEVLDRPPARRGPAVRRRARRFEGERQAGRHRGAARPGRRPGGRGRDVLHLPGRGRPSGGGVAARGRPGRCLPRAAGQRPADPDPERHHRPVPGRRVRRRRGPAPVRRGPPVAAPTCRPAGWGSTSVPGTAAEFSDEIAGARTVFWNGPMGVFEDPRFAAGTRTVAEAVADCRGLHRRRWRRQRQRPGRLRPGRPGRPRVHGRRGVARVHRAGRPAGLAALREGSHG